MADSKETLNKKIDAELVKLNLMLELSDLSLSKKMDIYDLITEKHRPPSKKELEIGLSWLKTTNNTWHKVFDKIYNQMHLTPEYWKNTKAFGLENCKNQMPVKEYLIFAKGFKLAVFNSKRPVLFGGEHDTTEKNKETKTGGRHPKKDNSLLKRKGMVS